MLAQLSAEFFSRSPVLAWPVLALGIFFCVFVAVSARALLRGRAELDELSRLPLQDAEGHNHD